MKRLMLSVILIFVISIPAFGQMEANFSLKGGIFAGQGATEQFGVMTAANLKLFSDSASGFTTYTQTGHLYIEAETREDTAKNAIVEMMVIKKRFTDVVGKFDPYLALGQGYVYEVTAKEGQYGVSLELGGVLWKSLGLSLSDLYLPSSGRHFLSINLDMMPVF